MLRTHSARSALPVFVVFSFAPNILAQSLPDGPSWGGGRFQPKGANVLFASGDGCALCHSASPNAAALWSRTGEDVSPHGLWQASLMAHAAKDPYWRAQVAKESERHPDLAADIEALCMRCHTPTAHHTTRLSGKPPLKLADAAKDPLHSDGVNCTICHQVQPEGLGTESTFDGNLDIRPGRKIFGPYPDPGGQPMIMHSAFTPTMGEHIRASSLCGSCHTLRTGHTGGKFPEQTPYFEWRNSIFTTEEGAGDEARSCQECHMPEVGPMRVARNPAGFDFNIATRTPVRGHSFVGGNAFMLDLLAANRDSLGVTAPKEALNRNARATRSQLSHLTVTVSIKNVKRQTDDQAGDIVEFDCQVINLTGHKFPTGYPSRRAWVNVEVRGAQGSFFASGKVDDKGRLVGIEDELALPHFDTITAENQVQIYELVAADAAGHPTTHLADMATRIKDTRLLPRGYRTDGPHASDTGPVGTQGDDNFTGGQDRLHFRIPVPAAAGPRLTIVARILYQPIPPAWVQPLRSVEAREASSFVRLYDGMKSTPEQIAVTVAFAGE